MAIPVLTWLDEFFGPAIVKLGTFFAPKRPILEFRAGGGTAIDVEDDEVNNATVVTLTGDVPGGAVNSIQIHAVDGADDVFHGTDVLENADGGFDFTRSGATSFPKSDWGQLNTTDAVTPAIHAIHLPTSGDGFFIVQLKTSYTYASSGQKGGTFTQEFEFKRDGGVLSSVASVDLSPSGFAVGTAPAAPTAVANGNAEIDVHVLGLASTAMKWLVSLHVQVIV